MKKFIKDVFPSYKTFKNRTLEGRLIHEIFPSEQEIKANYIKTIAFTIFFLLLCPVFILVILSYRDRRYGKQNGKIKITEKYPRDKWRKVVKEGILWDDIEWHER